MEALDEGLEDAEDAEGRDEASLGLDDSEDEDDGRTKKSKFELQQERMKRQIEELEEFNVGDKPWQLAGEVQAPKRPEDSLLQEDLDFEVTSRPVCGSRSLRDVSMEPKVNSTRDAGCGTEHPQTAVRVRSAQCLLRCS